MMKILELQHILLETRMTVVVKALVLCLVHVELLVKKMVGLKKTSEGSRSLSSQLQLTLTSSFEKILRPFFVHFVLMTFAVTCKIVLNAITSFLKKRNFIRKYLLKSVLTYRSRM